MSETSVKLHIYFDGKLSEEEVYNRIKEMIGDNDDFQIYDVSNDDEEELL